MKKYLAYILILLHVLYAVDAFADTHAAADCEYATVAAAVAASENGDTVTVAAGSCSWSTSLAITKNITLQGGIGGATTITNTNAVSTAHLIDYTATTFVEVAGTTPSFRLTAFTFDGNDNRPLVHLINATTTHQHNVKIDNNVFRNFYGESAITTNGLIFGAIGGNTFNSDETSTPATVPINSYGYGTGEAIWNSETEFTYGTADNLYTENNTFTGITTMMAGGQGGRYAARYNTFTSTANTTLSPWFDLHGNQHNYTLCDGSAYDKCADPACSSPSGGSYENWGGMGAEIYNNKLVMQNDNRAPHPLVDIRGGRVLFYNNFVETQNANPGDVHVREEYLDRDTPTITNTGKVMKVNTTYIWGNTWQRLDTFATGTSSGAIPTGGDVCGVLALNTDFFNTSYSYTPYTCPHPLFDALATGYCNPSVPGTTGYNLDAGGDPVPYAVIPSVASGSGTISPSVAEAVMSGEDSSTYTATPENGWKVTWSGTCGATGSAATYQKTNVTADCTVIATFTEIQLMPW